MKRRAPAISDERWHAILGAASLQPDRTNLKKARRAVERALRDYREFPTRAGLAGTRARWRRYEKLATKLHEGLLGEWRQKGWRPKLLVDYGLPKESLHKRWRHRPLFDFVLTDVRLTAETRIEGLDRHVAARKGRSDPPRQWLYKRLFEIWTDDLRGNLSASMTATGGPLVRFIRAVCALVDVTPHVSAVRAIIKAERRARGGRDISSREK